jgi:hypothetical protein
MSIIGLRSLVQILQCNSHTMENALSRWIQILLLLTGHAFSVEF